MNDDRTPFVGEQEAQTELEAKRRQEKDDRQRQALRDHFRKWKFTDEAAELGMKKLNAELLGRWPK